MAQNTAIDDYIVDAVDMWMMFPDKWCVVYSIHIYL